MIDRFAHLTETLSQRSQGFHIKTQAVLVCGPRRSSLVVLPCTWGSSHPSFTFFWPTPFSTMDQPFPTSQPTEASPIYTLLPTSRPTGRCQCCRAHLNTPFTVFPSLGGLLREFLTIASLAFAILFGFLYLTRHATADFLRVECNITHPELLLLVMAITALVLSLFAAMAALVRYLTAARRIILEVESQNGRPDLGKVEMNLENEKV